MPLFSVWLTAGMCAWQFFPEIISDSSRCVISGAHLVKKTIFPSRILPLIVILKGLAAHLAFLLALLVFLALKGMPFSLYYLRFFYYLFAMSALALGIGWLIAGTAPLFSGPSPNCKRCRQNPFLVHADCVEYFDHAGKDPTFLLFKPRLLPGQGLQGFVYQLCPLLGLSPAHSLLLGLCPVRPVPGRFCFQKAATPFPGCFVAFYYHVDNNRKTTLPTGVKRKKRWIGIADGTRRKNISSSFILFNSLMICFNIFQCRRVRRQEILSVFNYIA